MRENRPQSFAFVTYASAEQATKAAQTLNQAELEGRPLVVKAYNPKLPSNGAARPRARPSARGNNRSSKSRRARAAKDEQPGEVGDL